MLIHERTIAVYILRSNLLRLTNWRLVLSLLLIVGCAAWLTCCQTAPTSEQIDHDVQILEQATTRRAAIMYAQCGEDQTCKEVVAAWVNESLAKIQEMHQKAQEGAWAEAQELRKAWDQWFRETTGELLKNVPGLLLPPNSQIEVELSIIEDVAHTNPCTEIASILGVIEEDGHFVNLVNNHHLMKLVSMHPCFQLTATQDEQFVGLTTTGKTWTVSGTMTVVTDGVSTNVAIAGSIGGLVNSNDASGVQWNIITGHITATMPGGYVTYLNLLIDDDNSLTIDTNGIGQLSASFKTQYPTLAWGAILPYLNRIQMPVAISGGILGVHIPLTDYESLIPYEAWASSDYDASSVLDYESDWAAYIADFNNQDLRADLNSDGVWDQTDIDLWSMHFWSDYNAAQQ